MSASDRAEATSPGHRAHVQTQERAVDAIAYRLNLTAEPMGEYDTAREAVAALIAYPDVLAALAMANADLTPDSGDREELVDVLDTHMRLDDRGDAERVADALIGHPDLLRALAGARTGDPLAEDASGPVSPGEAVPAERVIEEMSEEASAWVEWHHAQNGVDTPGCDCGHDGMGPSWHTGDCRGAAAAGLAKARELHRIAFGVLASPVADPSRPEEIDGTAAAKWEDRTHEAVGQLLDANRRVQHVAEQLDSLRDRIRQAFGHDELPDDDGLIVDVAEAVRLNRAFGRPVPGPVAEPREQDDEIGRVRDEAARWPADPLGHIQAGDGPAVLTVEGADGDRYHVNPHKVALIIIERAKEQP